MREHKWGGIKGSEYYCDYCGQRKGQSINYLERACENQENANNTHSWIIINDTWVCKRCGLNGYGVTEGCALAVKSDGLTVRALTCEEVIMRKALE